MKSELLSLGSVTLCQAYLSEKAARRLRGATPGIEVKVCKQAVTTKSTVDMHLAIDAMNLKWTAPDKGVDAIAIASGDTDFAVVANEIRRSTEMDVYGLWPAGQRLISRYVESFTEVLRYGRPGGSRATQMGEREEAELFKRISELGYLRSGKQEKSRTAKLRHLHLFCHVHGLSWPPPDKREGRRLPLARAAHARVSSGEPLLPMPSYLVYIVAVAIHPSGVMKNMRVFGGYLILDMRGMDHQSCVSNVLEFLGFHKARQPLGGSAVQAFAEAQRLFDHGMQLDDELLQWDLRRQVEYLFKVFTRPDLPRLAVRDHVRAALEVRSRGSVIRVE